MNRIATKEELDDHWTIDDIQKANEILNFKDKIEEILMPKMPKK